MSTPRHVDTHRAMDKAASEKAYGKTGKDKGLDDSDIRILEGGYIERKAHMAALHDLDRLAATILAIVYSGTESLGVGTQDAINQSTVACAIDSDNLLVIASNKVTWRPKVTEAKYDHRHRDQTKYDRKLTSLKDDWTAKKKQEFVDASKPVPPRLGIPKDALKNFETQAEAESLHHHHMPHGIDPRTKAPGTVLFDPEKELRGILRDISNGLVSDFRLLSKDEGGELHAEMRLLSYFVERKYRPRLNVIGVNKPCCRFCSFWLLSFGIQISTYHTITPYNWTSPSCSSEWSQGISDLSSDWSKGMASSEAVQGYSEKLLTSAKPEEKAVIEGIRRDWPAPFRPSQ